MDKNGKIFGKINVIDFFVLLLLVGVIAGTAYRFYSPSANVSSGDEKITYVLRINGVRPFTADFYQKGLRCYDSRTMDFIGLIKDVKVVPFRSHFVGRDGIPYKIDHPVNITIYLTIEADGRETDDAFYANGTYRLRIGSELALITKYNNVITTIEAINDMSFVDEKD